MPPLTELTLSHEELVARFISEVPQTGGALIQVAHLDDVREKLTEIVKTEGIGTIVISLDDVIRPLDLPAWGKEQGVTVISREDVADREAFKRVVFEEAQAGITGVDFAVAETGTLGIIHSYDQPRLVSLAPVLHIAIVPTSRIVSTYEVALREVFKESGRIPSQFTFITGPSMTADIKATPFYGMHGPRRLMVILYGD